MRDTIMQAFQDIVSIFGDDIFFNSTQFRNSLGDMLGSRGVIYREARRIRNLLNIAVADMMAYPRLKAALEKKEFYVIGNLVTEMESDYDIKRESAEIVIGCIAELLGYIDSSDTQVSTLSSVLFCGRCGKANGGANKFCSFCGMEISVLLQPHLLGSTEITKTEELVIRGRYRFGGHDWIVLAVKEGKALLLYEHIWDIRPYHLNHKSITWENCSLRKELNDGFYCQIPQTDRSRVDKSHITNGRNLWYRTNGGRDTLDYVFLLSIEEADQYFGNSGDYLNKRRKSYKDGKFSASSNGWYLSNEYNKDRVVAYYREASKWWLRSPGYDGWYAATVNTKGSVYVYGDMHASSDGSGVRPALWLKL